jgi:N-methylhydantoinase B
MEPESVLDPLTFEIVKNALASIAEEMGIVLRKSSFSPNIKERRDSSCALFDGKGRLVAQAEHIPVHLGAMPTSVRAVLEEFEDELSEGDVVLLNDPFRGGTHLPDITLVTPIFLNQDRIGFAANRAHHSDVGGGAPGSMSSLSTDIHQEGLRIPPVKLAVRGRTDRQVLDLILANVRTPKERLGDLRAQQSANNVGSKRLVEMVRKFGRATVLRGMEQLQSYSKRLMIKEIEKMPEKSVRAIDYLDDDGFDTKNIPIRVKITARRGRLVFDFTGSSSQVKGPLNAVYSITLSAVYYVIRCVTDPKIPANEGCFEPVKVIAPSGSIVNALPPAPVAGGNVETSTRIVDVSLRAFAGLVPERVCAACQGTMNNVTIGGLDPRNGRYFTYYETIAGGFGARRSKNGIDGIHSHMTNTLNTPVEALEIAYPLRIWRYELIQGSGGAGRFRGGTGVRKEYELLADDATISLMGDRQTNRPWGLFGGESGRPGEYSIRRRKGHVERLSSKCVVRGSRGDVLTINTPGGGGYGLEK